LPKHLALGLDVRRESRVIGLAEHGATVEIACEDGATHRAPSVVLALPAYQASELLQGLRGTSVEIRALAHLLDAASSGRCLTAIVSYASATVAPDWDMFYPGDSRALHLASHDSAKRRDGGGPVLVLQALPAWSRRHWDEPGETWSAALLDEAASLLGPWAARAERVETHRWRYARATASTEFSGPAVVELPGGARLGLAGENFAPGGGAQAAFLSGMQLAARLARRTADAR